MYECTGADCSIFDRRDSYTPMPEDTSMCGFLNENYFDVCKGLKVDFKMPKVEYITIICKDGDYPDDAPNVLLCMDKKCSFVDFRAIHSRVTGFFLAQIKWFKEDGSELKLLKEDTPYSVGMNTEANIVQYS